jgi:hypothetical protein
MAKKKKSAQGFGREFASLFFGWFLVFASALVFFGDSTSLVGGAVEGGLKYLL